MPIYAYRCEACGHAKDVLQKMSDAQLSVCPVCHADAFRKQVTAAGFQLKGSGWYATDFKNNNTGPKSADASSDESKPAKTAEASSADSPSTVAKPAEAATPSTSAATATSPATAAKPAGASSGSD
jgi:putative FmdB family regulatory protein